MKPRLVARLYAAVAAVAVIPIWCVRYLPTCDGPSHLYNAWILNRLIRGANGPIASAFRIDWRPHPNWIGHAVMALLMFVTSPIIAEKLFVTGLVLLFLYAMWRYAGVVDESNRAFAFVAVPFAYNLMLQNGFYNFCAGVALYFLIVAVWWRRRDRPDASTIASIAALLVLCYFSHALPTILAVVSIGLLWLITLRGKRLAVHARHLLAFVPAALLLAWFIPVGRAYLQTGEVRHGELFSALARMKILYSFDRRQVVFAVIVAVILGALILATLLRRRWTWRERDAFGVLVLVIFAIDVLSQSAVSDVQDRIALIVTLAPLAALELRLTPRAMTAIAVAFAVLALAYCGYLIERYRFLGAAMTSFIRSAGALGQRATFVPLLYEIAPPDTLVPIYSHAVDYAAIDKEAVDITNYEPILQYFPIAFRPGVEPASFDPWQFDATQYARRAQYIFTWRMDANRDLAPKLAPYYMRVGGSGFGAVFRARVAPKDVERILLPLVGSTIDRGGAAGMFWRVEQSVQNAGPTPVTITFSACRAEPCIVDLQPGASAAIAANAPYAWAFIARADADRVRFATRLRRVDVRGEPVAVPAVRERDFQRDRAVIASVPFTDPYRLSLRVWTEGSRPSFVTVTLRDAGGRTLASRPLRIDADGQGMFDDLVHDFAGVPQRREPVDVVVEAPGATVWGFVSAIAPEMPTPSLDFPRQ